MTQMETREEQNLEQWIEQSVDRSVERAFRKYGRSAGRLSRLKTAVQLLIALAVLIGLGCVGFSIWEKQNVSRQLPPVDGHDLTLENDGIFGFTVVDFQEAVLGVAERERLLIVEERDTYVNTSISDTGLFKLGVFNKQQAVTIHGTGQYTIDLKEIRASNITLNEETKELTIFIPHATLHETVYDPAKTVIGDTEKGWLAFGSIKLTVEEQKEFETSAKQLLTDKLSEPDCMEKADRFAKLSAYETYQPIVKAISPAYTVVIEFQQELS